MPAAPFSYTIEKDFLEKQIELQVRAEHLLYLTEDKRILIWGYGREGKATEQYIKNHVHPKSLEVFEGRKNEIDEDKYDVIIKSPGIVMPEDDPKVTGETELFLSQFRGQTVGITGTKGKSTTSALLYTVLKKCGKDAVLVGNIGKPSFDEIENMKEDTIAVYEMSCHQLWHSHLSPHVAVFLDLYEEHLDYYRTLENYFHAKAHIAQFQEPGDIYYRGYNVPDIPVREGVKVVCVPEKPEIRFDLSIPGEYNQYNASIVYRIAADVFGLDPQSVREAMKGFRGLPHLPSARPKAFREKRRCLSEAWTGASTTRSLWTSYGSIRRSASSLLMRRANGFIRRQAVLQMCGL